jgi:hypothetical protein
MIILKNMAAASLIAAVSCDTVTAGNEIELARRAAFGDLASDKAVQSSAIDLFQCINTFQSTPSPGSLQAIHLACRDLKSQLNRHRAYFGTPAMHEFKTALLPLLDSAFAKVTEHQKNSGLNASKITLTKHSIESCRQSFLAERSR